MIPTSIRIDQHNRIKLCDHWLDPLTDSPYSSPELILTGQSSIASDVYSFAITLNELFGEIPFPNATRQQLLAFAKSGKRPKLARSPSEIEELIEQCWSDEISKRPSIPEILSRLNSSLADQPPVQWLISRNDGTSVPLDFETADFLSQIYLNFSKPPSNASLSKPIPTRIVFKLRNEIVELDLISEHLLAKSQQLSGTIVRAGSVNTFKAAPWKTDSFSWYYWNDSNAWFFVGSGVSRLLDILFTQSSYNGVLNGIALHLLDTAQRKIEIDVTKMIYDDGKQRTLCRRPRTEGPPSALLMRASTDASLSSIQPKSQPKNRTQSEPEPIAQPFPSPQAKRQAASPPQQLRVSAIEDPGEAWSYQTTVGGNFVRMPAELSKALISVDAQKELLGRRFVAVLVSCENQVKCFDFERGFISLDMCKTWNLQFKKPILNYPRSSPQSTKFIWQYRQNRKWEDFPDSPLLEIVFQLRRNNASIVGVVMKLYSESNYLVNFNEMTVLHTGTGAIGPVKRTK